jgi:ketosteroid isomerase-like protein
VKEVLSLRNLLMLLALCLPPGAFAQDRQQDEAAVRALEKERLEAVQKKDAATVERQLADDYSLTFEEGLVFDKAQVLLMVKNRPEGRHLEWTQDAKVRFYGNAAIITGRYFHDFRQAKRKIYELRYTDTYVKHKGRWYLVATAFSQALARE